MGKERKEEKKGLLGRLFGKGEPKSKAEKKAPISIKKPNNDKVNTPIKPPIKKPIIADKKEPLIKTKEPLIKQPQVTERAYLTKKESEEQYKEKSMEQTVFLFAPPPTILPVQKYINESFEGITCIGTSSIGSVISEYQNKLNSRHILVMIDSDTSLNQLKEFLNLVVSIKNTNPELLNIYVVLAKSVNTRLLTSESFASSLNIYQLPGDMSHISENTMDKILSKIVENQPVYIKPENKIQPPKPARKKDILTMEEPFRTQNIEELRKRVAEARINKTPDDEKVLENAVLNMKSQEDVDKLSDILPEISVLKTYGEQLAEYMESGRENLSPEQISELALSQLELSIVQEETIKNIFSQLVKSAENQANIKDRNIRHATREDANILSSLKFTEDINNSDKEIQDALQVREEVKQKAIQGFDNYKKDIKILSNAVEAQKQLIQGAQKQLMETIDENQDVIPEDLSKAANLQLVYMDSIKDDIEENKKALQVKMTDTLNYVSTVFKDYNVLISIDDILIERLVSDREKLKANNIKKIYTVDNKLQLNSKMMVLNGTNVLKDLMKSVIQKTTLVITTIDDMNLEGKSVSDSREFLEKDYSFLPNIVTVNREYDLDAMPALIKKLKYIAAKYNKVVFLFENIDQKFIDIVSKEVPEVVFVTGITNDDMISTNYQLKNIRNNESVYSITIMVYGFEDQFPYEELLVNIGALPTDRIFVLKPITNTDIAKNTVMLLRSV